MTFLSFKSSCSGSCIPPSAAGSLSPGLLTLMICLLTPPSLFLTFVFVCDCKSQDSLGEIFLCENLFLLLLTAKECHEAGLYCYYYYCAVLRGFGLNQSVKLSCYPGLLPQSNIFMWKISALAWIAGHDSGGLIRWKAKAKSTLNLTTTSSSLLFSPDSSFFSMHAKRIPMGSLHIINAHSSLQSEVTYPQPPL